MTYDLAGRITAIVDSANDMDYGYDTLGRLTSFASAGNPSLPSSQTFTYDANGNRLTFAESGAAAETYTYQANSNRLLNVSGPVAKSYTYDANGNITDDEVHTYVYDGRNRLISVNSGAAIYKHNGLGARVLKDTAVDILFGYDEFGQLVGEYDSVGAPVQETVFFGSMPVGVLEGASTFYVYSDHLGSPRAISDGSTGVWRWDSDPFGAAAPDDDPDGDGQAQNRNLRFPGQYYDSETSLHNNYFRDYDPVVGRYSQSDPIGLVGGPNSYSYVSNRPLMYSDPFGLAEFPPSYPVTNPGTYPDFYDITGAQRPVPGPGMQYSRELASCGFTGCIVAKSGSTNNFLEVPFPIELGATASFCMEPVQENICHAEDQQPLDINVGLGRFLGVTKTRRGYCVNIGVGLAAPVSASLDRGVIDPNVWEAWRTPVFDFVDWILGKNQ